MPQQGRAADVQPRRCVTCPPAPGVHKGQFVDKPCAGCHVEGGTRTRAFTHNKDTRVPARRLPQRAPRCAASAPTVTRTRSTAPTSWPVSTVTKTRTNTTDSSATTAPSVTRHPAFQKTCASSGNTATIPAGRLAQDRKCEGCHVNGRYQTGRRPCVNCHEKNDPHRGQLGRDCGKCHRPEKGAPSSTTTR